MAEKTTDPEVEFASLPIATAPTPTPVEVLAAAEPPKADTLSSAEDRRAAEILVRHLFAHEKHPISGIEYAVLYKLANGDHVGGDIVDLYHFDNGSVSFAIADVSGKGADAAIHAALVKFGLRCYASEGLTPERTVRSLDRVFIENNAFERTDQFASVFFAILDDSRRALTYANAGHEPVLLIAPDGTIQTLAPTAPLVGVFDDQHHLFRQRSIDVQPGTFLIATTDGITEARSPDGEFFGMDGLVKSIVASTGTSVTDRLSSLLHDVEAFSDGVMHDDIAAFAIAIL
jgi:serine phosphatase RsbU (regulator of sigma subunit)